MAYLKNLPGWLDVNCVISTVDEDKFKRMRTSAV